MARTLAEVEWPLRTERLAIRRAAYADAAATFAYRRQERVAHWLGGLATDPGTWLSTPESLEPMLVVELGDPPGGAPGPVLIGDLYFRPDDPWGQLEVRDRTHGTQAEIGWAFDPAYGGRGYASEAVDGLIGLCFGPLGLRRVVAHCFADNTPSWRLMERVGMRREAVTVRDSLHRSGEWLDGLSYALLADEWGGGPPLRRT